MHPHPLPLSPCPCTHTPSLCDPAPYTSPLPPGERLTRAPLRSRNLGAASLSPAGSSRGGGRLCVQLLGPSTPGQLLGKPRAHLFPWGGGGKLRGSTENPEVSHLLGKRPHDRGGQAPSTGGPGSGGLRAPPLCACVSADLATAGGKHHCRAEPDPGSSSRTQCCPVHRCAWGWVLPYGGFCGFSDVC